MGKPVGNRNAPAAVTGNDCCTVIGSPCRAEKTQPVGASAKSRTPRPGLPWDDPSRLLPANPEVRRPASGPQKSDCLVGRDSRHASLGFSHPLLNC